MTDGNNPGIHAFGAVHIIGIGGAGTSALAKLMVNRGVLVTGSDPNESARLDELRRLGITISSEPSPQGSQTIVISAAVDRRQVGDLDLEPGTSVLTRGEALARVCEGLQVAALAGSHGKTTVAAMLICILREAGLDPSFCIGGVPLDSGTNAEYRSGGVIVVETDEADHSFLHTVANLAVVTNMEFEPGQAYRDPAHFRDAFVRFCGRIAPGGTLVISADDEECRAIMADLRRPDLKMVTFGRSPSADIRLLPPSMIDDSRHGRLNIGRSLVKLALPMPGEHNALNAAAAIAAAIGLGVDGDVAASGLARFRGVERRLQTIAMIGSIRLIDDYGHHPMEVAASVEAAMQMTSGRLVVLLQPLRHSRAQLLGADIAKAISRAAVSYVLDPCAADSIPGVTGATIARHASDKCRHVSMVDEAVAAIVAEARPGDTILAIAPDSHAHIAVRLRDALGRAFRDGQDPVRIPRQRTEEGSP